MARVITPDGSLRVVTPARGPSFTLEEMRTLVGGYLEVVRLPNGELMVIDEEGKLKHLLYNPVATALAAPHLFPGDYIVGTAVVMTGEEMGE